MIDKKMIRSSQCGFIKVKSCLTNLMIFYNENYSLVDEEKRVHSVYPEFISASDAVSHNILASKLSKYGLDELMLIRTENWSNSPRE